MCGLIRRESNAAFMERPALSWRALIKRFADLVGLVRTCYTRHRQRQDLLNYLESDYRAAADIGVTKSEMLDLSRRPFWRV